MLVEYATGWVLCPIAGNDGDKQPNNGRLRQWAVCCVDASQRGHGSGLCEGGRRIGRRAW